MSRDEYLAALTTSLRDLTAWLTSRGIPHAVIGGVATAFRGRARITEDIDAVVLAEDRTPEMLLADAKEHGFLPRRPDAATFAAVTRILQLQHEHDGITVDLSLGMLPFERELIDRSTTESVQDTEFPVATAEDLVVMKVLAFRGKDVVDIESVLDANPSLDLKRVRRWVGMLAEALDEPEVAQRFDALIAARPAPPPRKRTKKRKKQ